jgi:tRNA threonylcarbamoyladenosine biosynthesis protein TsaB
MSLLFVDTSHHIIAGLLNEKFEWLSFVEDHDSKSSKNFHKTVHNILIENDMEMSDVTRIINISGPGSYTGMRLTEGFSQILEWQDYPRNSFYHFNVPELMGVEKGIWFSKAFKGEFFLYEWDQSKQNKFLVPVEELDDYLKRENVFTHFHNIDDVRENKLQETSSLIYKSPKEIFETVISKNLCESPYYYRPEDIEFQRKK